jgi:hypothetical protein
MRKTMFKSFAAAALYLMANGYDLSAGSIFKSDAESVVVVKSSSGYWTVKSA